MRVYDKDGKRTVEIDNNEHGGVVSARSNDGKSGLTLSNSEFGGHVYTTDSRGNAKIS